MSADGVAACDGNLGEPAVPWEQAAERIGIGRTCRKKIVSLVEKGHLVRLPGVAQVMITAASLRAYLAGETAGKAGGHA